MKKAKIRVKRIDILEVELPLKRVFKHALSARKTSNSIFIKLYLEDGTIGYGEALPREYVTNETTKSVSGRLCRVLPRKVIGAKFFSFKNGVEFINRLKHLEGATRCCIELALLDALGKHFKKPVSSIIGEPTKSLLSTSGVIQAGSIPSTIKSALEIKAFGFKSVKVKVGLGDDLNRLKVVRNILGKRINVRVDANCAWGAREAIEKIGQMREFGISAVEQPVRANDIKGLKKVSDSVNETIIADESLTTIRDAKRLANINACDMFNIRLSKCGGILNALKIVDIAHLHSIRYQLGCQVGESGVLSAAGRHFAFGVKNIEYYEGSYGKFLLKEDVTRENMTIGLGGKAQAIVGPGLGINVVDRVLDKYTVNRYIID